LRTASVGALADAVGQAYGLVGSHTAWARAREVDLAAQIDAKLPELLAIATTPAKKNASDDFFGESSALGEIADTVGFAAPPAPAIASTTPTVDDLAAIGVPARTSSSSVVLLVGGTALVLGILVVIAFVMLR
jgi:hypothetical protein